MYFGEEMVGVLDVEKESLDKRLEMVVKEGGDSFSGEPILETMGRVGLPALWILGSR